MFLLGWGFLRCEADLNVYAGNTMHPVVIVVYVEDLLIAAANTDYVTHIKKGLSKTFEMKDLYPGTRN